MSDNAVLERTDKDKYVADLVDYLKKVHKFVDEHHAKIREDQSRAKYRELGVGSGYRVGDYVLVKKPLEVGVSKRFQTGTFDNIFQVVEVHGDNVDAKAYTLSNLQGSRDNLGFSQPVAVDRLIPIELLPLQAPADDQPTRLRISDGGRDRDATLVSQCLDGKVYIKFDDEDVDHCLDLTGYRYSWLT